VCNPLKPRLKLDDAETLDELKGAIAWTDKVAVSTDDRSFATEGLRYGFVDPKAVTDTLKRRAKVLGCIFVPGHRSSSLDAHADAAPGVAAAGPTSPTRTAPGGFPPDAPRSSNVTVVFQSAEPADALRYLFRTTEHGIFHALVMPRGPNGSSVIVETPAETLRVSGLDKAPPECIIALCRKLFALSLDRIVP